MDDGWWMALACSQVQPLSVVQRIDRQTPKHCDDVMGVFPVAPPPPRRGREERRASPLARVVLVPSNGFTKYIYVQGIIVTKNLLIGTCEIQNFSSDIMGEP